MEINLWAVLGAAVVAFLVGWAWYSPMLFGKTWMRLSGISMPSAQTAEIKGQMYKSMTLGFVGTLVMSYVTAMFVTLLGITETAPALLLGFWIWLGFIATVMAGGVLWEQRPANLYFFNAFYQLVNIEILALILSAV